MDASYAHLKDFDWSLRLVLSSDKLSGLRRPLLMIKLDIVDADGAKQERLVELSEAELEILLTKLKKAQSLVVR
jgi:COMM domain